MKRFKALLASVLLCMAALMLNAVTAFAASAVGSISPTVSITADGTYELKYTVTVNGDEDIAGADYVVLLDGTTEIGRVMVEDATTSKTTTSKEGTYSNISVGDHTISLAASSTSLTGSPEVYFTSSYTTPVAFSAPAVAITVSAPTTEAPTTEAPTTEAPTTVAVETTTAAPQLIAIKATYNGPAAKTVGEVVTKDEVAVVAVFDNGLEVPITDWTSDYINVPLIAGSHNLIVNYGPLVATFSVNVVTADASSQAAEASSEIASESASDESSSEDESSEEETTEDNTNKYITVVSPFDDDNLYMAVQWDSNAVTTPDGFKESTMTYSGYDVKTLTNDIGVTLVYMTDETGANGDFYIYDETTQKFSYFVTIPADEVGYYILSFPDDFDDTGLTKMTITLDAESGKSVTGYHLSKDKEDSGAVCLVYAMDSEGNKGYYRFDTNSLSFVRYYEDAAEETEATTEAEETTTAVVDNSDAQAKYTALAEKYNKDILMRFYVIIVLIVLAVILFVFVIILAVKLKKLYSEYDFIDDDESGDGESEDDNEDEQSEEAEETETAAAEPEAQPDDEDFRVDLSSIEEAGDDDDTEDDE